MIGIVRIWIWFSACLAGTGWILSALHQLNPAGYLIALGLATGSGFFLWKDKIQSLAGRSPWRALHKFQRRCRRPLPFLFLVLALMSLLGGALYACADGDGLEYREPRVLHWLAHEQWHWIRTLDYRMNIAGCNYEWLCAPLILFTHTDRLMFLINCLSYVLLPGLIFSMFIRLGVARRVAWWWMWLLASGWCYVFQAGSSHNDSYAIIYALASVDLALRAREKGSVRDLWLSLLAAALVTGVKQTDILLAVLWLIAAWPGLGLLFRRPVVSLAIGLLGLVVSALPSIILNIRYAGNWMGIPAPVRAQLHSPFWGVVGNIFCLSAQNLMPPFFPWADRWDAAMRRFTLTPFGSHFSDFEDFAHLRHSVSDETAGLGLAICILVLISIAAACWYRRPAAATSAVAVSTGLNWQIRLLHLMPWLLLLIYMAKVGTYQNGRQLGPYYVFFFPLLLTMPVQVELLRHQWWRQLGFLVMLGTAGLLVLSRQRPLLPMQSLVAGLQARHPNSKGLAKLANSYSFQSSFETQRNLFRTKLPPTHPLIGYLTSAGQIEPGLWFPLGRSRVERVMPEDSPDQLRERGIQWVVIDDPGIWVIHETLEQWMARYHAQLIDQLTYMVDPYTPLCHVYLVKLGAMDSL